MGVRLILGGSSTSISTYLPPPPGPPGMYRRFLRGGPSLASGFGPLRVTFGPFREALPADKRYFDEEYGAILREVHEMAETDWR
jgi:hypothetical protein